MDQPGRIDPISLTPNTPRQTPRNDFGQVLARALHSAVSVGGGVARGAAQGNPVLSAAVNGLADVISQVAPSRGAVAPAAHLPSGGASLQPGGGQWDLLDAQRALQQEGHSFNASYLQLQEAMQRESREFNTVSNVMKVRHDSAKAAINNIR
jgi:hypothetical protein